MEVTTPAAFLNETFIGGLRKKILLPIDGAQPDNIQVPGDNNGIPDPTVETPTMGIKEIVLPVAIAIVILVLVIAAAIRWRYRNNTPTHANGQCKNNIDNNNKNLREAEEGLHRSEQFGLLNNRNLSTSSSASTVDPTKLIEESNPTTVSMRIASDTQNTDILKSSRTDLYCETNPGRHRSASVGDRTSQDSVKVECEVLKEISSGNLPPGTEDKTNCVKKNHIVEDIKDCALEETFPKRPKTLQVMTVVESNAEATNQINSNSTKGFPWEEQEWTPDADVIYEDNCSPENSCDLRKEGQDCIFPLMGKGRFKMKPKGLLERRGSNVALTISLKNEEKTCSSPPPSSRSPKPLVYLRTATAKLDPVQLHIKASDTARLQREFWEVPMNHPSEKHFSIPGYGTKNRYRSILPNPHSRVLLPAAAGGDPLSAYINANYIRGFSSLSEITSRKQSEDGKENDDRRMSIKRKASFIATQGPMANTIVDFWKMVWRENSSAIIMITKLKEKKEKCAEYMPTGSGESQIYEHFEIKIKNVRYADHYTVRTIEVRNAAEEDEVRTITHYWYAEWLDHETPDKLRSLLTLVQEVDLRCPDVPNADHGPVIVHCSAGIGRTGCFIAINIGCRQLRIEGKVDPLRIICQLRMDRGGMIQTWEQYQYVHVALSRYARILAGENVNTPLTGSSIITPDSRGSSKHTTPSSGSSEFKSPLNSSRLFSPKLYSKTELATVVETENSDHKGSSGKSETEQASVSPKPGAAPQLKSRFSFSCAEELNSKPSAEVSKENGDSAHSAVPQKEEKPYPHMSLKLHPKLSPVRDENWLMNGYCRTTENGNELVGNMHDSEPAAAVKDEVSSAALTDSTVDCDDLHKDDNLDSSDLGKLENIFSPRDESCKTSPKEQDTKSSIFMFPTPEK